MTPRENRRKQEYGGTPLHPLAPLANVGVVLSGLLGLLTGSRFPDLVVGGAIGVHVVKEAIEILSEAREARTGE